MAKKPYLFRKYRPGWSSNDPYHFESPSWDFPELIRGHPGQYENNNVYWLIPEDAQGEWFTPATKNDLKHKPVHGCP